MKSIRILAWPALLALALVARRRAGAVDRHRQLPPRAASPRPRRSPAPARATMPTEKDDKIARGDRKFIEEAAGSGMFEVQVAQLAASKATDPQVKSFASMLVDHHTAANNELVKIANARKVELPAAPKRALRRDIEKLGKKNGAEFDREFVREVGIKAHEKDIKLFQKASKDVKDAELKAFVDKTLPRAARPPGARRRSCRNGQDGARRAQAGAA